MVQQALSLSNGDDGLAQVFETLASDVLARGFLDEVIEAQTAEHSGALPSWQDVVSPRRVVSNGHGGIGAQENRAGVLDAREHSHWVGCDDF